jgi:hypothetical protein
MTAEQLIPNVTGPASALIVCLLIGLAAYKLAKELIIPMMQRGIDRHLDQVDGMMKMHSQEHAAIMDALGAMTEKCSTSCKYVEGK